MSTLDQVLDAVGPEQIRTAFTTAITTTTGHAGDLTGIAGVLGDAADRYETLQMTASTLAHLRDSATAVTAAAAALSTADEQLQAALADFDARDHRVADAVADADNLMRPEAYTDTPVLARAAAPAPRKDPSVPTPHNDTSAGPSVISGLGGDPDARLDWSVLHPDGRRTFALNGTGVELTQDEIRRLRIQLARIIDDLPADGTLHPAGRDDGTDRPCVGWDRAENGNLRLRVGQGDAPAVAELTDAQLRELHARLGQQLDIDADLITPPVATAHDPGRPGSAPPVADVPARVSGARIDRPRRANGWGELPRAGRDHFHPDGAIPRAIDVLGADAALDVDGDSLANRLADLATRGTLCQITPQDQADELRALAARMPASSTAARTLTMTADDLDAPTLHIPALPNDTAAPLAALVTALADVPSVRRDPDRELHPLLELIRTGRARGPLAVRRVRALINHRHESEEGKAYIDSLIRCAARDLESEASNTPTPTPGTAGRTPDPDDALRRSQAAVKAAGHTISTKQLAALHGLYKDLVKHSGGAPTVYGVNVRRQLDALADKGIIARTGASSYMIPSGSPGEQIIAAAPDFPVGAHLLTSRSRQQPRPDGEADR